MLNFKASKQTRRETSMNKVKIKRVSNMSHEKTHLAREKKTVLHHSLKINKQGVLISSGWGCWKKSKS